MSVHRRSFLKTAPALFAAPAALASVSSASYPPDGAGETIHPGFPAQDPALAREMVGASHGNVARVRELLLESPALARATWDWGFGDWETALGAASHVGNREIAGLLMENGARPDIFAFAMLGHLDAVKACVAALPGIQRTHGPHGLTLLHHARKGGEASQAVVAFLEGLGDADLGYPSVPLADADKAVYAGDYAFGPGPGDQLRVSIGKEGFLGIKRLPDGSNRGLNHLGNHEFNPAGNATLRIRFTLDGGRAQSLDIADGRPLISARRVEG
jgi:hypothetical protein